MSKPVRVKPIKHVTPDLRKLARALLLLASQQQADAETNAKPPKRRAS
jgi:hypothetical protein